MRQRHFTHATADSLVLPIAFGGWAVWRYLLSQLLRRCAAHGGFSILGRRSSCFRGSSLLGDQMLREAERGQLLIGFPDLGRQRLRGRPSLAPVDPDALQ